MGAIISRLSWVRLSPAQRQLGSSPVLEMLGTTSLFLPSIVGAVVSGFNVATTVWQLYLILFSPLWLKILVWLCELVLYPASLCSLVVGCQYTTNSFRNSMQLETNTIVEHILNVAWAMMRSVLVWGFILSRCLHIRCHCSFGCFCCLGMPQCFFVFVKFLELISQNLHRKRFFFCGEIQTFMSANCFSLLTNKTASSRERTKVQFRFVVVFVYFIWVCSSNANFVFGKCALNLVESCHIMHRMEQTWVFIHFNSFVSFCTAKTTKTQNNIPICL